jgi:hypothetical protein
VIQHRVASEFYPTSTEDQIAGIRWSYYHKTQADNYQISGISNKYSCHFFPAIPSWVWTPPVVNLTTLAAELLDIDLILFF